MVMHNRWRLICVALMVLAPVMEGCAGSASKHSTNAETEIIAADAMDFSENTEGTAERQTAVLAETGYYRPIDEAHPDPSRLPLTITYGGTEYTRLSYISDTGCEKLKAKATYTYYSDTETANEVKIIVYSVGVHPDSACIATNFGVFAPGTLLVYVNEAEWTGNLEE